VQALKVQLQYPCLTTSVFSLYQLLSSYPSTVGFCLCENRYKQSDLKHIQVIGQIGPEFTS